MKAKPTIILNHKIPLLVPHSSPIPNNSTPTSRSTTNTNDVCVGEQDGRRKEDVIRRIVHKDK
ncbi:hypothetical protein E2C01_069430 [Portunus trituberculatus]|uniref:Uncharacterized protein n=1 Tax=Portunus trituberculatus TaxID=210409 RepID=A0A5B7HZC2_PORTR|nr:hypothetical protein [Portunus trituberculatus]